MYSQKKPSDKVLQILKEHNIQFLGINYYAWPELFSSTSGPRGGIGGQALTTFTMEAWVCDESGPTVYECAGVYRFEDKKFEPVKRPISFNR